MDDDPSKPSPEPPEQARAPKKRAQLTWSIRLARLWQELKDRDVVRVAIGYTVVGWVIMQVGDIILPNLGFPQWVLSGLIILIILGFPVSMALPSLSLTLTVMSLIGVPLTTAWRTYRRL